MPRYVSFFPVLAKILKYVILNPLPVGPAKKSSQNLILKLLGMLAISQFKARFQARKLF